MSDSIDVRRELQATGQFMMQYGLAWGNAGNISARVGTGGYLITASGTYMGELGDDDFVECGRDGTYVGAPGKKPSKETPMHRAVYEEREEIGAVLHASPFYSTMVACSGLDVPADWFVETMYYLERVERVSYCHPGSEALGAAVRAKARQANILLLENHGVLVYDISVKEARMALQTLEMACRMLVESRQAGIPLRALSPGTVEDFLLNSGYKPRRNWS
ncbi:fuculose phosphate aldolase [Gordoniibacillus kamchatkensis]|uniref:Fuculose phosphate aldolase n=1 Tax=Gordoniibacillus kamchatkensis TaxID=1590651 RepID=A0ABR5ABH8_9BACL|nr:class II aldolase/adducin family protein [Paenibacillus sp. VKM B-2647]KIL38414.1 fuculose phosphate aldolase [Paenibacillus sp. VKM B-2647]